MKPLYIHTEDVHNMIAPREVVPTIIDLVNPQSVLDVGCGTGTWLRAFEEAGVSDYMGVDGDYVDRAQLNIHSEKFIAKDLRTAWTLNRKFDLVISLEVAEHLPEESADLFVNTLVSHTNETIIFSAAIPGQGGQHHINEQWPEYWQQKFMKHGFYFHDMIRPLIWDNDKIDWWYRQNVFLVTKRRNDTTASMALVHPQQWNQRIKDNKSLLQGERGLRISASVFINALIFKLRKIFR